MLMLFKYFLEKVRTIVVCKGIVIKNLKFFSFNCFINRNMSTKPPNILVYTGNCSQRFKQVEESILKCLKADCYIVYHLLDSEINKSPWMENSLLLVVSSDVVENAVAAAFEIYLKKFGNILFMCSKIDNCLIGNKCLQVTDEDSLIRVDFKDIGKMVIFRGKYSYDSNGTILCQDNSNKPLIQKMTCNENILITSEIYLDRDPDMSEVSSEYKKENRLLILKHILNKEYGLDANNDSDNILPELSPGYFVCDKELQMVNILNSLKLDDKSSAEAIFYECKFRNSNEEVKVPVYFCNNLLQRFNFNETLYFSSLHSDVYGHHFVYFPVITSTMEAAEQLSDYEGIVIAAGCQISGKGRGNNKWISPKGCAMFTLHSTVPLHSNLGKKLTLLQHIASLAVVHGIKSKKTYEDLELKIKWPNDIYHGTTKIGGLLVTTVIQGDSAQVNTGWGINVANSHPTLCLNDIIDNYNSKNVLSLPHLDIEEIMALTISQMEYFVKDFMQSGPENFLKHYYLYWMHNDQKVTVTDLNQQGIIIGIDEYGFLKIKTDNGKVLVLQPDGNRFDIMKNLIYTA